MFVDTGLDKLNGNRFALTIRDVISDPLIFHAFDTNLDGQLITRIKVVGYGGQEQVLLDR